MARILFFPLTFAGYLLSVSLDGSRGGLQFTDRHPLDRCLIAQALLIKVFIVCFSGGADKQRSRLFMHLIEM
jgi:hypothetical protein